jgi:hypothetical protein
MGWLIFLIGLALGVFLCIVVISYLKVKEHNETGMYYREYNDHGEG